MQRPAKPFTPVRFRLQPPNVMKVGIIGYGRIGKWLMKVFDLISSEVFFYDKDEKYKSFSRFREKRDLLFQCDIVLICASDKMRNGKP